MRAALLKTLILLCLGCLLTTFVAVGFFLFTSGRTAYGQPLQHESWILDHGGSLPSEEEFGSLSEEYQPGFGVDWRTYRAGGMGFARYVQAGWPVRCLDGGWWLNDEGMREYNDVVHLDLSEYSWVTPYSTFIPVGVKWLGLCIDTLLWAALLWTLFFGPGFLRRVARRRKGRCLTCGYDLRGIFEGGCPECGWRREEPHA